MGEKGFRIALWTDFERYRPGTQIYAEFSQAYHCLREHGLEVTFPEDVARISPPDEIPSEQDLERVLEETTHLFIVNPDGLEEKMHGLIERAGENEVRTYLTERPEKRNGAGYAPVEDFLEFQFRNRNFRRPEQSKTPYLSAWK